MDKHLIMLRPRGPCAGAVTSNTLFGAVCWALETLRLVNVTDMLAEFTTRPRFVFSSAFPCAKSDGPVVRCFPKPMLAMPSGEQVYRLAEERAHTADRRSKWFMAQVKHIAGDAKRLKNTAYVSDVLFAEICAGQWDSLRLLREWGDQVVPVGDTLWLRRDYQAVWGRMRRKAEPLWRLADVQRNAIDRVAGATAEGLLFHETQMFFAPGRAGLWFLALADPEAWQWLTASFRYLSDTGVGGKRTVGKGHFDFTVESAEGVLPDIADADSFVALSRYLPQALGGQPQPEASPLSYALVPVYQRPENKFPGVEQMRAHSGRVRLFAEGSVFGADDERRPCYGRIVPLCQTSGRTVWYSGLTVPAFAKLGGVV
jgi:CRISPR type III-A-associated RAMP protein Csm4